MNFTCFFLLFLMGLHDIFKLHMCLVPGPLIFLLDNAAVEGRSGLLRTY